MDQSASPTSAPRAVGDTLAALLGVKGPLRLLPQEPGGPALKPHIVLKRDIIRNEEGTSAGVVRFSFIAGKRYNINKGTPLLFAIAPTAEPGGGKMSFSGMTTYLLEGDILEVSGERSGEHVNTSTVESASVERRVRPEERLPPKMRKSATYKQAYANFSAVESAAPAAPPTPPQIHSNTPPPEPRVFVDTEVQTEALPQLIPRESTPIPRTLPYSALHPNDSPTQLPSPVSADHTRENIADALAQSESGEVSYDARSDRSRSLSPMDLESESCTPATTLVPLPAELPLDSVGPLLLQSPRRECPSLPPAAAHPGEDVTADPAAELAVSPPSAPSANAELETPHIEEPSAETTTCAQVSTDECSSGTDAEVQEELPTTNSVESSIKSPLFEPLSHASKLEDIPTCPRAMLQTSRAAVPVEQDGEGVSHKQIDKSREDVPKDAPPARRATPTFVKGACSSVQKTSGWDWDVKQANIPTPTPTITNPLGILPSSSLPALRKPIPTGPRSLQKITPSTSAPTKKPVVVGAKWSAGRHTGSSATSSSHGGMSASSSSSSLARSISTVPTSPPPPAKHKLNTDLSEMLGYASPSPPPSESRPLSPMSTCSSLTDEESPVSWSPARTPNPYSLTSSSHPVLASPTPQPWSESPAWTRDASSSLLLDPERKSRKRGYDEWKRDHWSTDANTAERTKKVKLAPKSIIGADPQSGWVVAAPASSPPVPAPAPTPTPLTSTDTSVSRATPDDPYSSIITPAAASAHRSPRPAHSTGSWSARVVVPIPKVPLPLTHPLPLRPVASGSSYRPSSTKSKRKHKPPPRLTDWPATSPNAEYRLNDGRGVGASVQKIVFNNDGSLVVFICADSTLRIWDNKQPGACEVARLPHEAQIASACWLEGPAAVMTLCSDGALSTWTRNAANEWKYAQLIKVSNLPGMNVPLCMDFHKDRIAVSMMSVVKVWLLISGKWQPQREIVRSGVTALKFVQDGNALIGGCRDGVLWHCEVPNGTLRVHAFLSQKPIVSIDTHPTGTYLLIAQEGGKAHLVTMRPNQNKGSTERTYTSEKIQTMSHKGFPAVFATKGQAVLYGQMNDCALVWDRKKGTIVYGLKHPEGDPVETAATFDGRPGVEGWIITGTKQGRVFWWPVPVAAAPGHSTGGRGTPINS